MFTVEIRDWFKAVLLKDGKPVDPKTLSSAERLKALEALLRTAASQAETAWECRMGDDL
jgi:hypothetical protein